MQRSLRVPATLQALFIASGRGKEVHEPPPDHTAAKVFVRNRFSGTAIPPGMKTKKYADMATETAESNEFSCKTEKNYNREKRKNKNKKNTTSKRPKPKVTSPTSPQMYLDMMLRSRGYSIERYKTTQTGYYCEPTPLQLASYRSHLISLARERNVSKFEDLLRSGISPNACNQFGESLVHMVCRQGSSQLLRIMLERGLDVQVADDCGRTPLHDACWTSKPCFEIVEMLLSHDGRLFYMTDFRGATPLSYVRSEQWSEWITWMEANKDKIWPSRNVKQAGEEGPPPLAIVQPKSRLVANPEDALTPELADMVSSGKISPYEAQMVRLCQNDDDNMGSKGSLSSLKGAEAHDNSSGEVSGGGDDDDEDDDDEGSNISRSWGGQELDHYLFSKYAEKGEEVDSLERELQQILLHPFLHRESAATNSAKDPKENVSEEVSTKRSIAKAA